MSELTLDEAIKYCLEVASENDSQAAEYNEHDEWEFANKCNCEQCASDHRQVAEWLRELKDMRAENKVLMAECDRLIKEKGELLSKVSGGDVLRICQLEEQLDKAKELLRLAVSDINYTLTNVDECTKCLYCNAETGDCSSAERCYDVCKWKYADEALKLLERG